METAYLITGTAGFIGFHLAQRLLQQGATVVGYDNLNDYYDVTLKQSRLHGLQSFKNFTFIKGDLTDKEKVEQIFSHYRPQIIIHLAAQAGVRYSIDNPAVYIQSNIIGFFHILEACRHHGVDHLIYASSSSVYGANQKIPFSTTDRTDHPVSLYAATKKSNELMAYTYSHLYRIPTTGLRFFTVYGPYGRPDMAYYKFTQAILAGQPIQIFNQGNLYRDFTYIDDIITGMTNLLHHPPEQDPIPYKIYNIGNNRPEHLLHFIEVLEDCLNKKAVKQYLPMQPGDVYQTYADVTDLIRDFAFQPSTSIETGLQRFVAWYLAAVER